MGQSGVLEADKLMFADSLSSPEKIEVVMGRCFPLNGPGNDYDALSIPVVRKIIYKNRDGATFTQTFSDVISSENDNYRIPVSDLKQQVESDKQSCKQKGLAPFVKLEASDGTRSEAIMTSPTKNRPQEDVIHERQEKVKQPTDNDHRQRRQTVALPIDSGEMKRISAANSPRFKMRNKDPPKAATELTGREAWEETQKKKAQLREEFFKVPYEECNREAIRGMGGRLNKSEPKLNTVAKERKKRNSLSYKRRVHFNMDDSQLEDMRKWREERRMQAAAPQVIKTVARIYSLDAPSNSQRQIEYISAFDSPKAEVPVAISIQDSPPTRTKVARPTDLDSLQSQVLASGKPADKSSDSNPNPRTDINLRSGEVSDRTSASLKERLAVPHERSASSCKVQDSTPRMTSQRIPYPCQNQSQSTIQERPSTSLDVTSPLSPQNIPPVKMSVRSKSSKVVTPSFDTISDPQQLPDDLSSHTSSEYRPQTRTRSASPPASLALKCQPTVQKQSVPLTQRQQFFASQYSYTEPYNTDTPHKLHQPNSHQPNQEEKLVTSPLQNNVPSNDSVRPKDPQPHLLLPVPLPRSKSLSAKRGVAMHGTPYESQRTVDDTSVRSKIYTNRRATSLDRAQVSKRLSALSVDPSHSLKSPGLILNHLRSPTPTSPVSKPLSSHTGAESKQSFVSPFNVNQTSQKSTQNIHNHLSSAKSTNNVQNHPLPAKSTSNIQNHPSPVTTTVPTATQFGSVDTPACNSGIPQNPVNIIRSYTYPKRNSQTLIQNTPQPSNRNLSVPSATRPKDPIQGYQEPQTQSRYFIDNISNIPSNYQDTTKSYNIPSNYQNTSKSYNSPSNYHDTTKQTNNKPQQQYHTSSTNSNRKDPHRSSNKENEGKSWSQKTDMHGKGNSVKILMTKGESFSKHRIVLNSHMTSMTPRVTVKKIIVPASSTCSSSSAPVRSAPSPTPSCASSSCSFGSSGSSSGCFSGSPSPTPTPSPTRVRASGVPTDL